MELHLIMPYICLVSGSLQGVFICRTCSINQSTTQLTNQYFNRKFETIGGQTSVAWFGTSKDKYNYLLLFEALNLAEKEENIKK